MQTRTPAPVAPPKAHSRRDRRGPAQREPGLLDRVGRKAPRGQFLPVGGVGRGRHCDGRKRPGGRRSSIGCETRRAEESLVALEHAEVDLDEVRRGARRAEREHGGGGRVGTGGRGAVLRDDRRELRDVRGGLGDRQRVRGRPFERRPDQLVLGVAVDVERQSERGQRVLVDLVVQRCELGEPLAEDLRLRDRGAAKLPLRASSARPSRRAPPRARPSARRAIRRRASATPKLPRPGGSGR